MATDHPFSVVFRSYVRWKVLFVSRRLWYIWRFFLHFGYSRPPLSCFSLRYISDSRSLSTPFTCTFQRWSSFWGSIFKQISLQIYLNVSKEIWDCVSKPKFIFLFLFLVFLSVLQVTGIPFCNVRRNLRMILCSFLSLISCILSVSYCLKSETFIMSHTSAIL